MQLFLVDQLVVKGNQIFLSDVPDLLSQLRKVLRMKIGDEIFVQKKEKAEVRYHVQIGERSDTRLEGNILEEMLPPAKTTREISMLVAMPNKWEKAELIAQKLTEIGISHLLFRPAERSIITGRNPHKHQRLLKIAKEAVEQSWWWKFPEISYVEPERIPSLIADKEIVIFDKKEDSKSCACDADSQVTRASVGVIGPEGGLTASDYSLFPSVHVVSLWSTVLRMETAAIVGGRFLCHHNDNDKPTSSLLLP